MAQTKLNKHLRGLQVLKIDETDRSQDLQHKRSFCGGHQHDHFLVNWTGASREPGMPYIRARMAAQGFVPAAVNSHGRSDVPSWLRRPDCPVPLGRQIVGRFTEMVIGGADGQQPPELRVWGDVDTQEALKAVFKRARIWEALMAARDMTGAQGCSAILSGIVKGRPYVEILDPVNLWVAEWDQDVPWWRPKVVVEQLRVSREEVNPDSGKLEDVDYWETRAWTETETVIYEDVKVDDYREGDTLSVKTQTPHGLQRCPVVWYTNSMDPNCPYGEPDYEGVYEQLDQIDRLQSQVHKASSANVDPTLVLKEDQRSRRRQLIQKGKVIGVPSDGDAKYLEITGSSIETAQKQLDREMEQVMNTVQCVVISSSNSTKLQSSEAMQMLWRPMEAKSSRLRIPLMTAIEELADVWCLFGEKYGFAMDLLGAKNDEKAKAGAILLPPRRDSEREDEEMKPHKLGKGGKFTIEFQPYFKPTPQQVASAAAAMSTATGAKQFLSVESAAKTMCGYLSRNGTEELALLENEKEAEMAELEEQMEQQMERSLKGEEERAKIAAEHAPEQPPEQQPGKLDVPSNKGGARPGSGDKPKSADEVKKPAAKAKSGKRGPGKPG